MLGLVLGRIGTALGTIEEGAAVGVFEGLVVGPPVGLADPRIGAVEGQYEGRVELVVDSLLFGAVDERLGLAVGRPSQARVCSYTTGSKG